MKRDYSFIDSIDERIDQFASKAKAILTARLLTQNTGRKHQIILTTTYRNLQPRLCWGIILAVKFNANGALETI